MKKDPLLSFLCIVVVLMAYATLYPFRFQPGHSTFLEWSIPDSRGQWLDVVLNLYFFVPFGILCGCRFRGRWAFLLVFCVAFCFSLAVELMQAYIPGRNSSLRDVFLNSIGAYLGMLLTQFPIFDPERLTRRLRSIESLRGTFLLVSLWIVIQFFPFVPVLKLYQLRLMSISSLGWQSISAKTIEIAALSTFVLFLWSEHQSRRSTLWFGTVLMLLSPLQLFLWSREPIPAEIFASIIGFAIGLGFVWSQKELHLRALTATAIGLLLWRELQPFSWEASALNQFNWIPFQATFEYTRTEAIHTICLKCFLYWYTLRQIHRASGITLFKCASAMAAFFLVAEWSQCYQIGRTPEITDALLCLMGAIPFLSIADSQAQGL